MSTTFSRRDFSLGLFNFSFIASFGNQLLLICGLGISVISLFGSSKAQPVLFISLDGLTACIALCDCCAVLPVVPFQDNNEKQLKSLNPYC